ncbi:uncharacterized protein Z520_10158 [Fonsecaea multimorphosa CBS 102226]|uniref:ceramidase n=1 Tax=Fonsecaea multimorphosa CBS 102226 TaxID=1442371 RepID=A0A0D2JLF0_9EURO|nr:uncharacterized protein Z520_10158 [Fonsecaea multimorphosa CBS 102226]KIX94132.1 hypothetical protein Z520_10158 [Fonsecaea multimorphosa CBS 102226]OAL19485.1 hypothetical protein AYO22_09647 [Fonsecaea multimorphosa]
MAFKDENNTMVAPIYIIDLSLEPENRYKALAQAYKSQLQGLTSLFNSLLSDIGLSRFYHGPVSLLARLLLRGLYSPAETAELRGIAKVSGVPMHLLVSFNVILDCLMGCTSGAVKVLEAGRPTGQSRMLHFRTLDWSMDPLRSIIVQLEFVRSRSATPGQIVARSVTYVGFTGILTGVREELSLSLNFRGVHNAARRRDHARFYLHHLLVLLGYRQSISSILRGYITPEDPEDDQCKSLQEISDELVPRHTTAAYLLFCDGVSAMVIEKDYETGVVRQSNTFIGVTNNDEEEFGCSNEATPFAAQVSAKTSGVRAGMEALIEESRDRLDAISLKWRACLRKARRKSKKEGKDPSQVERTLAITTDEVIEWVSAYPTTNEQTHFATVMDPVNGQVVWTRTYPEPAE